MDGVAEAGGLEPGQRLVAMSTGEDERLLGEPCDPTATLQLPQDTVSVSLFVLFLKFGFDLQGQRADLKRNCRPGEMAPQAKNSPVSLMT